MEKLRSGLGNAMKFVLVMVIFPFCGLALSSGSVAVEKGKGPVELDAKFVGKWLATKECEKHSSWPDDLEISKDKKNSRVFKIKRGDDTWDLNMPSEVVEKDHEGLVFRTIKLPESYNKGRQLVVGSIWRHESEKKDKVPPALSIIMATYSLKDDATLIYEKYGYESEERAEAAMMVAPYSKQFPKNYRCVFSRVK